MQQGAEVARRMGNDQYIAEVRRHALDNDAVLPGEQLTIIDKVQVFQFRDQHALVGPVLQRRHFVQDLPHHLLRKCGGLVLQQVSSDFLDIADRVAGPDDLDGAA